MSIYNAGIRPVNSTVRIPWNTAGANGASITRATNGSIRIYKDGSTTERTSGNGITDNEDYDTVTGPHYLFIDTSDDTDAGFYAAGSVYAVMLVGAVIDGQTVNTWLGTFELGVPVANVTQWLGTAAATPTVAGVPEVDVTHLGGVAQSLTDLKDFADDGYDPATNKVQGVVLVDTTTTNTDMRGTDGANTTTPPTAEAVADAVWDEAATGHTDAGKAGAQLWTDIDAILVDSNELQGDLTDGGRLDLLIDAILADTGELQTDWANGGRLDLLIDAIKAKTDGLNFTGTDVKATLDSETVTLADASVTAAKFATDAIAAAALSAAGCNKLADHVLRRTVQNAIDSANGDTKAFRSLLGAVCKLVNKVAISGTTLTVYEDDDTTSLGTQTVTSDADAEPVTAVDTD